MNSGPNLIGSAAERLCSVYRSCPACGARAGSLLLPLTARDFASHNWSYVPDYARRLGIDEAAEYPIDRCKSCSFVYARYLPSEVFLNQVYDEVIDTRIAATASATRADGARRMRYVARLASLAIPFDEPREGLRGCTALDFGSGFGRTSRLLAELGCNVVAFDPSAARRKAAAAFERRISVVSTVEDVLQRGTFDILVIDNVLEHLPDPRQTVRALVATCAPGAIVFVSVPSYEPDRVDQLVRDRNRCSSDMSLNPWEYLNYFDLAGLDRMMAEFDLIPLRACELSAPVEIGLRPEPRLIRRVANALSSMLRLARFVFTGNVMDTVEERYYRHEPLLRAEARANSEQG